MAQAPQPELSHAPPMQHPVPAPIAQLVRVPDTRQRKLGIHPFDEKELDLGLCTGLLSWGKRFVTQVQFAKRACEFLRSEDLKVDELGHHFKGVAERYYNQHVVGWWEKEEESLEHATQRLLHTFKHQDYSCSEYEYVYCS